MSSSFFRITEHIVPAQHIREFPHGVRDEATPLQLKIKEYQPLNNLQPLPGAVTFIAAHAIGVPKETYEPLWDDLLHISSRYGFSIRAIWIADSAHLGYSGLLNQANLGDDPCWYDHSRDLLGVINHFRSRIVQPIFGVGHSMSAAQIIHLATLHPRLFSGLVISEPVIQRPLPPGPNAAIFSSLKPSRFPSRAVAERALSKSPYFAAWDPRCLERFLEHGLRDAGSSAGDAVELTTPTSQESWSYNRGTFAELPSSDKGEARRKERLLQPHIAFTPEAELQFFRPEALLSLELDLPRLRPAVLFLYGANSPINGREEGRAEKERVTGMGLGGSGGAKEGMVKSVVVDGTGHMLPVEKTAEWVGHVAGFVGTEVRRWKEDEKWLKDYQSGRGDGEGGLSKEWIKRVKQKANVKRERITGMEKL